MKEIAKKWQQLLAEIDEFRTRLDAAERRLQDANEIVEWREGISPPRSPKTGHEPLDSSGSYCPALN